MALFIENQVYPDLHRYIDGLIGQALLTLTQHQSPDNPISPSELGAEAGALSEEYQIFQNALENILDAAGTLGHAGFSEVSQGAYEALFEHQTEVTFKEYMGLVNSNVQRQLAVTAEKAEQRPGSMWEVNYARCQEANGAVQEIMTQIEIMEENGWTVMVDKEHAYVRDDSSVPEEIEEQAQQKLTSLRNTNYWLKNELGLPNISQTTFLSWIKKGFLKIGEGGDVIEVEKEKRTWRYITPQGLETVRMLSKNVHLKRKEKAERLAKTQERNTPQKYVKHSKSETINLVLQREAKVGFVNWSLRDIASQILLDENPDEALITDAIRTVSVFKREFMTSLQQASIDPLNPNSSPRLSMTVSELAQGSRWSSVVLPLKKMLTADQIQARFATWEPVRQQMVENFGHFTLQQFQERVLNRFNLVRSRDSISIDTLLKRRGVSMTVRKMIHAQTLHFLQPLVHYYETPEGLVYTPEGSAVLNLAFDIRAEERTEKGEKYPFDIAIRMAHKRYQEYLDLAQEVDPKKGLTPDGNAQLTGLMRSPQFASFIEETLPHLDGYGTNFSSLSEFLQLKGLIPPDTQVESIADFASQHLNFLIDQIDTNPNFKYVHVRPGDCSDEDFNKICRQARLEVKQAYIAFLRKPHAWEKHLKKTGLAYRLLTEYLSAAVTSEDYEVYIQPEVGRLLQHLEFWIRNI